MGDHKGARLVLDALPPARSLIADRGYDSAWFRPAPNSLYDLGRSVRGARVMTEDGSGYAASLFRKVPRMLGVRHIRTRPYQCLSGPAGRRSV